MRISIFSLLLCQLFYVNTQAQVYGCMDPLSSNYNPAATISNGSCIYPDAFVALKNMRKFVLPEAVHEISGIICFDGKLYGHNDSGGEPEIYEMDTTSGVVTKTIILQGAQNVDWEEITQDESYVYVGDVGNNTGDRTDLKIYRFPKQSIRNIHGAAGTIPSSDIDVLKFKYEDQTDFSTTPGQNTRFDCEAMIYDEGNLHLFTKNWISNHTVHYVISATPTQAVKVAIRKDSLNTEGVVITGASRLGNKSSALLGYQVTGIPSGFMWIISGYSDMNEIFKSGNKRKINIGAIVDGPNTGVGQVEGIALANDGRVFISSEYFSRSMGALKFTIPQSLYGLDISQWLPPPIVLAGGITDLSAIPVRDKIVITWRYNEQPFDRFEVESSTDGNNFSTVGTITSSPNTYEFRFTDPASSLTTRVFYRIKVIMKNGSFSYSNIISVKGNQNEHFNLRVTPSSFQQALHLNIYSDKDRGVELNLFDLYGRKLDTRQWKCTKGDNQYQWHNLSSLPKAVYFITARSEEDMIVQRITKN